MGYDCASEETTLEDWIEKQTFFSNETVYSLNAFYRTFHPVHIYLSNILCCFGVLANLAFLAVLAQRSMRTPINVFLIAIAIADALLMTANFIYRFSPNCPDYYWAVYILTYANVSVVAHNSSLWLTVMMAILRYRIVHTKTSIAANPWCRIGRALSIVAGTVAFVILGTVSNMLRNVFVPRFVPENSSYCGGIVYELVKRDWWTCEMEKANFWMSGLIFKIVPCILLSVFIGLLLATILQANRRQMRLKRPRPSNVTNNTETNYLMTDSNGGVISVRNGPGSSPRGGLRSGASSGVTTPTVSSHHQHRHERTTATLIIIVAIFLITELPQGILVLAIGFQPELVLIYRNFGDLLDLLSLINSCANFILYCAMSEKFRFRAARTFQLHRCSAYFRHAIDYGSQWLADNNSIATPSLRRPRGFPGRTLITQADELKPSPSLGPPSITPNSTPYSANLRRFDSRVAVSLSETDSAPVTAV